MSAQLAAEGPGLDSSDASGPGLGLGLGLPSSEQIEILRDGVPLHANEVIGNNHNSLLVFFNHTYNSCYLPYTLSN